jgi:hypothetical protein
MNISRILKYDNQVNDLETKHGILMVAINFIRVA